MPKYNTMSTKALGDGTKLAAWHLQVLAVLPELQNKGIGKSLMKAVESKVGYLYYSDSRLNIAQASAQGVSTCLEAATEKNVRVPVTFSNAISTLACRSPYTNLGVTN